MSENGQSTDPFSQLSPEGKAAFGIFCVNALRRPRVVSPILTDDPWFLDEVGPFLVPEDKQPPTEQIHLPVEVIKHEPCGRFCCRVYDSLADLGKAVLGDL